MSILMFLFLLAVISVVFSICWNYLFLMALLSLVKALRLNLDNINLDKVNIVIKGSGYYLMSSLFVITLYRIPNVQGGLFLVNAFLGLAILFTTLAGSSARARSEADRDFDFVMFRHLRFDGLLIILACAYYVVAVIFPSLARNPLTESFFRIAIWFLDLPVIGFLLGIVAVFTVLKMILAGAFTGFALIASVFASRKNAGS